ncbi:MAG: hypothetical protein PHS46_08480 [Candidatus Omnitrophica bacterium]|nr:hypothetical protein [Candidatus Omnitrophota bacterium]
MIKRIEGNTNIGITALIDKINEIIDQVNIENMAKDAAITTLQTNVKDISDSMVGKT